MSYVEVIKNEKFGTEMKKMLEKNVEKEKK